VALYRNGTGESTLEVTILGTSGTYALTSRQLVQQQLSAVGIGSKVVGLDATALISEVVGAHYQVFMFSNYSSPDPDQSHYA
jgi:ABC-type transport system substrate-binding protein